MVNIRFRELAQLINTEDKIKICMADSYAGKPERVFLNKLYAMPIEAYLVIEDMLVGGIGVDKESEDTLAILLLRE